MDGSDETASGQVALAAHARRSHAAAAAVLGLSVLGIVTLAGVLESDSDAGGKPRPLASTPVGPADPGVPALPDARGATLAPSGGEPVKPSEGAGTRLPGGATIAEPSAPPEPPGAAESLAERARTDVARLSRFPDRYTAQLAVACRLSNVERLLRESRGSSSFYVLPAVVAGRACFRICWGTYASREEAARAADLPGALRAAEPRPRAVRVAEVLP